MMIDDALLFIDANKYLDLYRTKTGKLNLAALSQQAGHIFVTQRIVDEVKRNKIKETAGFLTKHWELARAQTYDVPDHLFGVSEDQSKSIRRQMEEIRQKIKQVNTELHALAMDIMTKVSQSTDEVSTALAPIFANAVCHSDEQLQKAKERKERGDPPGKQTDPIGDQVTWEQILGRFVGKTKLWIITRDSDYGSIYDGKGFLNQFLYEELASVSTGAEVFLFENVPDGIKHFAEITGVTADKLPTPAQIEEIKVEEETLPPARGLDWTFNTSQRTSFFDVQGRLLPITSFSSVAQSFDPLGRPLPNPGTDRR
jgi:PIN domain